MKNFTKLFALAVVILGFSATSFGQKTFSLTANATIKSVAAIESGAFLDFGTISSASTTGTVTMSTGGSRGFTPGVTLLPGSVGSAGAFTVTAQDGDIVNVIMPGNILLTTTAPGTGIKTMTILAADWTYNIGDSGDKVPSFVMTSNTVDVKIGAILQVVTGQQIGAYTADYPVTVNLN